MKEFLYGKSLVVTGRASGIGQAAALLLAESGCLVTIGDPNESAANKEFGAYLLAQHSIGRFAAGVVRRPNR
jgi:NAD(P)-dependent dehydrogenase (short-subunit alcohol dehydrogenase family)